MNATKLPDKNAQFLKWARYYAYRAFSVFPVHTIRSDGVCSCGKLNCERPGKHPAVQWKAQATIDPRRFEAWWNGADVIKAGYCYNIGMATGKTSGITVVDIDLKSGGLETWERITERYTVPDTYTVQTGGGGYHLYFKYTPKMKTGTNLLGPGIDIRNDGGYVIAPPSVHKSGKEYTSEINPLQVSAPQARLAEMPESLITLADNGGIKASEVNLGVSADINNSLARIPLSKAAKLLEYISPDDYQTWLNVGVILGRCYSRSDDAWKLYNDWADKYDGDKGDTRNAKMEEAFFQLSQQEPADGRVLTLSTLFKLALDGGYVEGDKRTSLETLAYIIDENAYLQMLNDAKWTAQAVNNVCMPVTVDGDLIKPAVYLANYYSANSVTNSLDYPAGILCGGILTESGLLLDDGAKMANTATHGYLAGVREIFTAPVEAKAAEAADPVKAKIVTEVKAPVIGPKGAEKDVYYTRNAKKEVITIEGDALNSDMLKIYSGLAVTE